MRVRGILALLAASALVGSPTWALTDEEIFRDFRFNLKNPGARAMGLGGAFLSLADDATAAQANPAGLGFMMSPEIFAEMRATDNGAQSTVLTETLPTGIDTFLATGTDMDDTVSLSFLSGVYTSNNNKWAVGASRQELVNISNATLSKFAFTYEDTPGAFLAEGTGAIDVDVVNWNVSGSWRPITNLGIGATVTYSKLNVQSLVTNTIVDTAGAVAPSQILEPTLDLQTTIDDDDDDVVFGLGILYKVVNKWSVGGVYRRGPSFEVEEQITANPGGLDIFRVSQRVGPRFVNTFSLPDTAAVGGSWNPTQKLTLTGEIQRILYSNLMDRYVSGINVLTEQDAEFTIDDATDYRAGVEYVFMNSGNSLPPMAARGGLASVESSTIRATSPGTDSLAAQQGVEAFRAGERYEHLTLGLGLIFKRYKFDFAADFAETNNEFLISFIYKTK